MKAIDWQFDSKRFPGWWTWLHIGPFGSANFFHFVTGLAQRGRYFSIMAERCAFTKPPAWLLGAQITFLHYPFQRGGLPRHELSTILDLQFGRFLVSVNLSLAWLTWRGRKAMWRARRGLA